MHGDFMSREYRTDFELRNRKAFGGNPRTAFGSWMYDRWLFRFMSRSRMSMQESMRDIYLRNK